MKYKKEKSNRQRNMFVMLEALATLAMLAHLQYLLLSTSLVICEKSPTSQHMSHVRSISIFTIILTPNHFATRKKQTLLLLS